MIPKKKNRQRILVGFTLIELIVFIALTMSLSLVLFPFALNQLKLLSFFHVSKNSLLQMMHAQDHIAFFVRKGPSKREAWHVGQELRWTRGTQSCALKVDNNKLYRYVGGYDPIKNCWHSPKKIALADSIHAITWELDYHKDKVLGIRYIVEPNSSNRNIVRGYCAVRARGSR